MSCNKKARHRCHVKENDFAQYILKGNHDFVDRVFKYGTWKHVAYVTVLWRKNFTCKYIKCQVCTILLRGKEKLNLFWNECADQHVFPLQRCTASHWSSPNALIRFVLDNALALCIFVLIVIVKDMLQFYFLFSFYKMLCTYIYWCLWTHHVPGIIRRFGSFNTIRPPPGDPAGADLTPACVRMAS